MTLSVWETFRLLIFSPSESVLRVTVVRLFPSRFLYRKEDDYVASWIFHTMSRLFLILFEVPAFVRLFLWVSWKQKCLHADLFLVFPFTKSSSHSNHIHPVVCWLNMSQLWQFCFSAFEKFKDKDFVVSSYDTRVTVSGLSFD